MKKVFVDSYIAVTAADKSTELATFNTEHFSKLGARLYPMMTAVPG